MSELLRLPKMLILIHSSVIVCLPHKNMWSYTYMSNKTSIPKGVLSTYEKSKFARNPNEKNQAYSQCSHNRKGHRVTKCPSDLLASRVEVQLRFEPAVFSIFTNMTLNTKSPFARSLSWSLVANSIPLVQWVPHISFLPLPLTAGPSLKSLLMTHLSHGFHC